MEKLILVVENDYCDSVKPFDEAAIPMLASSKINFEILLEKNIKDYASELIKIKEEEPTTEINEFNDKCYIYTNDDCVENTEYTSSERFNYVNSIVTSHYERQQKVEEHYNHFEIESNIINLSMFVQSNGVYLIPTVVTLEEWFEYRIKKHKDGSLE